MKRMKWNWNDWKMFKHMKMHSKWNFATLSFTFLLFSYVSICLHFHSHFQKNINRFSKRPRSCTPNYSERFQKLKWIKRLAKKITSIHKQRQSERIERKYGKNVCSSVANEGEWMRETENETKKKIENDCKLLRLWSNFGWLADFSTFPMWK